MKISRSCFDYGGEIDVCFTYQIKNKPARVSLRRRGDLYELYAVALYPVPSDEEVIACGSLDEVLQYSNSLMRNNFGPDWRENDELELETIDMLSTSPKK